MESANSQPGQRLRRLLKEAGFKSFRMGGDEHALFYSGRTRDWNIIARMNEGWFNAYTSICDVPLESGLRARTLDLALTLNRQMTLPKFVVNPNLILELYYRSEHVDSDLLRDLVGVLHSSAEEHYPKIFRTVTGDDVLASLEPLNVLGAA